MTGLLTADITGGIVGAGSLSSTSITGGDTNVTGDAGVTTFNGGALTVGGVATIGTLTSGTANLNGATSSITTLNGGTINLGTTELTVGQGTFAGTITGANGSLVKNTVGTLNLDAANTYGGSTTVAAGILNAVTGALANTSAVIVNGGTLNAVDYNGTATLTVGLAGTANISGQDLSLAAVTNDGLLSFTAPAGTITLASLAGAGTTSFSSNAVIGTRSGDGTLDLAGDATINNLLGTGTIDIAAGRTLSVAAGNYDGTLQGDGSLSKFGFGTLTMTGIGAADYRGTTTVNSGTLEFSQAVTLSGLVTNNATLNFTDVAGLTTLTTGLDGTGTTTFSGDAFIGTRDGSGTLNLIGATTITTLNGTGIVDIAAGNALTVDTGIFEGTLQGGGSLVKSSGAWLVLIGGGAGSYLGTTTVNAGALRFTQAVSLAGQVTNDSFLWFSDNLGTTTLTTGLNGGGSTRFDGQASIGTRSGTGTLWFLGGNSSIDELLGTGEVLINGATLTVGTGDYSGNLVGGGSLLKSTADTLVLRGFNAGLYAGTTTVTAGTLEFTAAVQLNGQVTNNSVLNFTDILGTTFLFAGLDGTGTTNFSGDAVIGTRSGDGTLNLAGDAAINNLFGTGTIDIAAGRTLSVAAGSYDGTLQGDGSLSKFGFGTLTMTGIGAADYQGTTTVADGTLEFTQAVTLVSQVTNNATLNFTDVAGTTTLTTGLDGTGTTTFSGDAVIGTRSGTGTLVLGGATSITTLLGSGTIDIAATKTLSVDAGTFDGTLQGGGSLAKNSAMTLTINGPANYLGTTTVNNGTLVFTQAVTLAGQVTNNATLNFTDVAGLSTLTTGLNGTGTTTFSGDAFIGTRSGSGTLNLNGDTEITSLFGTGTITIAGGKTVDVSNGSFSGILAGAGSLSKSTAGVLTLTNANTFSGQVDVYAGTLITANNSLQNVPQIYVYASGTLNGVNYKTDADLAIDQGGTATFSAAASAITGTIWNNGNLTLNPALGGNSTITLSEFYGAGATTITRGNLLILNNALNLGATPLLDPVNYDNTLPVDLTWGYGAGGGGHNSLTLIGTLTADISGGTVHTTNLFSNYIFDVDMLGDLLNGATGVPLGILGQPMGGQNVFLDVNVSGAATVGVIAVDGTGSVNFAGTASVVTLRNGAVNLTGTLGEFTNVEGGAITATSADVKVVNLNGGTHLFNGVQTLVTNFGNVFGGNPTATATGYISVGTMRSGNLILQGSGPSSVITHLNAGLLNVDGADALVTINDGNSPVATLGADIIGTGSLTKLTTGVLNLNTINLSGTTRLEGTINVNGAINSLGIVINGTANNAGFLNFTNQIGTNTIGTLQNGSGSVVNFSADSSIGELSGSGVLTINDATKVLTIQSGSFSGTISGAGNLLKSNTGTLVLSGTNVDNYTGVTTINGGTLEFSSAVTLTGAVNNSGSNLRFSSATGTTTLSDLMNNFGGSTVFTGASSVTNVINANGATIQFNGTTSIAASLNNLNGSYAYINAGGFINVLQGVGETQINNAGVTINQRFNDGVLKVNSSSSIGQLFGDGHITLSNSTLSVNEGATAGIIDGNGSLTKNGAGALTLSGANVDNYTGTTNVTNGTLVFDHDAVYLAGQVTVSGGGTLSFTAATGTTWINNYLVNYGSTTFGSNAILGDTYNHANTLAVVGNLTGSFLQSDNGSASVTVGGLASLNHLRNYAGQVTIDGLTGSNSIGVIENWDVTTIAGNLSGGSITNTSGTTWIGGNYVGTTITTNGGATQVIGNATVSNVTTNGGTTQVVGDLIGCANLLNRDTTVVNGNATVNYVRNYSGSINVGGALNSINVENSGSQVILVGGDAVITDYLTNDGSVSFGATATITTLHGSGTTNFAGLAQVTNRDDNGTANFADDSSISNVANGGSLTIAFGKTLTLSNGSFSGSLSGQGSIVKNSGSSLLLSGANVDGYLGDTTVSGGALVFDTASTLAGQVTNNATLNFTSGSGVTTLTTGLTGSGSTSFAGNTVVGTLGGTGTASVSIAAGKTLTVNDGSFDGSLSGGGSLVKSTVGTLTLNGAGAAGYTGTTTVGSGTLNFTQAVTLAGQVTNNGTLRFTNAGATELTTGLAGSGATSLSGNTLVGTLNGTNTASVSIAAGKTLTVKDGSFDGSLTGDGSLVKATAGALTLSGVGAGGYAGTTTVSGGTLVFTKAVTLVGQVTNNGTLDFTATAGTTTLSAGLVGSGTTTFSGNGSISSRAGSGVVNFLGDVTINNVSGSGDLVIAAGKSLTIEQGTYAGSITGSGDLVKTTAGQLILNGATSSFGDTDVQAGLLTVNSSITTTGVTVASGASLGGSGTINGNVVVSGYLAPGNSPGILNVVGTETLANGSAFLAEIGGSTAGNGNGNHDQSNVTGNVVIGTGVDLSIISWNGFTSVSRGDTLTILKSTGGISGRFADTAGSGLTGWTLYDNSSDAGHLYGNLYGTGLTSGQTFAAWGTNPSRAAVAGALWTAAVTQTADSALTAGANRVGFIDTNTNAGRAALALVNAGAGTDALLDSYSPEAFLGLGDYAQITARTLADGALNQTTTYTRGDWGIGAGYSNASATYIAGSTHAFDRALSSSTTYANITYNLNRRWKTGFFYGHNSGHSNAPSSTTNIHGGIFGLSLTGLIDGANPISLKAAITSSSLRFDTSRSMAMASSGNDTIVAGTGTSSSSDNKLSDTSIQVSASMLAYTKGRFSVSPAVGLVHGSSKSDAFTETGTGANLAVAGMSSSSTRGVIGLNLGYEASLDLSLSLSLGLERKFSSDTESVTANIAGAPTASFNVAGTDSGNSLISTLGLGVSYRLPNGFSANVNAEFRSDKPYNQDKRVNLSVNRRF